MARTVQQIYNDLRREISSQLQLSETGATNLQALRDKLEKGSNFSVYSLLIYTVAVMHHLLEVVIDARENEIKYRMRFAVAGNIAWYVWTIKKIQATNNLVINGTTGVVEYSTVIEADQFVGYATARKNNRTIYIYVRDKSRNLLNDGQLEQCNGYMAQVGFAGIPVRVLNAIEYYLFVKGRVYYKAAKSIADIKSDVRLALITAAEKASWGGTLKAKDVYAAFDSIPYIENVALDYIGVSSSENAFLVSQPENAYTRLTNLLEIETESLNIQDGFVSVPNQHYDSTNSSYRNPLTYIAV